MSWTVDSSGTQAAVIGTEHILSTPSTAATYQLNLDCSALTYGDILEVRVYKMIDGTNFRQLWKGSFSQPQINTGKVGPYVATAGNQLKFTITQTAGTGRSFIWSLERQ